MPKVNDCACMYVQNSVLGHEIGVFSLKIYDEIVFKWIVLYINNTTRYC